MFTPRSTLQPLSQENANVMQRKNEATKSTRKAFADRSVNQNQSTKKPLKPFSLCDSQKITKPKQMEVEYPSYLKDVCSYREVNSEYWGIMCDLPEITRKIPTTPPPTYYVPISPPIEIASDQGFLFDIIRHDDSFSELNLDQEPKIPEVHFNDFSF